MNRNWIVVLLFLILNPFVYGQTVQVRYRLTDQTVQTFGPYSNSNLLNLGTIPPEVDTIWVWSTSPSTDDVPRIIAQGTRTVALKFLIADPALEPSFPADSDTPILSSGCRNWGGLSFDEELATYTRLAASISGDLIGTIEVGQVLRLQAVRSTGAPTGGQLMASINASPPTEPLWAGRPVGAISLSHGTTNGVIISTSSGDIGLVEVTGSNDLPSLRASIYALYGRIENVIVARGSINIPSPGGITCRDGITLIQANSIDANITANFNNGPGGIREMRTTRQSDQLNGVLGSFSGSLSASVIGDAGLSTPALQFTNNKAELRSATITTTGDLLSDIVVSGSKPTVLNVTIGGNMHSEIRSNVPANFIPANTNAIGRVEILGYTQSATTPGSKIPLIKANGTIGEIHFHGPVLPYRYGSIPKIECDRVGVLKFDSSALLDVGDWTTAEEPVITVAIGELLAEGYLGGKFILRRDSSPSSFSVKGDCSAGFHFRLPSSTVLPPISVGGTFTGSISVIPITNEDQTGFTIPRKEPLRALAAFSNVCAVAQLNPHADFDGTINVPISGTTSVVSGKSVNFWNSSGSAHGHLSSRPADVDRLLPVGGGAFGAYPYSLHYADCSPRPVPGEPRKVDPAERPFAPLYPDEEPLDSEFNRDVPEPWIQPAQPVVLRFDGYVRSTLASDSPFIIEYVQYIDDVPIFATVNPLSYVVTVKRPGDSGLSREASILGYGFAPGIHRIRLRTDVSNPLLAECAPPCPSGFVPSPVRPFAYYFNIVPDCGQDGTPGTGGPQGCPCQFNSPCEAADFNIDGGVDGTDVAFFFDAWENGSLSADMNVDGAVNGDDISAFFCWWDIGGC